MLVRAGPPAPAHLPMCFRYSCSMLVLALLLPAALLPRSSLDTVICLLQHWPVKGWRLRKWLKQASTSPQYAAVRVICPEVPQELSLRVQAGSGYEHVADSTRLGYPSPEAGAPCLVLLVPICIDRVHQGAGMLAQTLGARGAGLHALALVWPAVPQQTW